MENKKIYTCSLCGEEYDENEMTSTRDYELACISCENHEYEYASSYLYADEDGAIIDLFTKHFGEYPEPVKEEKWKSTSAWRGYTYWEYNEDFEVIEEGWVTGYPDSTTQRKIKLSDLYDKIRNEEVHPPCQMWWLFGLTSNVFSQSSDLIVRSENKAEFLAWLVNLGFSIDKLHYNFG
jgi:hypothetical protein